VTFNRIQVSLQTNTKLVGKRMTKQRRTERNTEGSQSITKDVLHCSVLNPSSYIFVSLTQLLEWGKKSGYHWKRMSWVIWLKQFAKVDSDIAYSGYVKKNTKMA